MKTAILFIGPVLLLLAGLYAWRLTDHWSDRKETARLLATERGHPPIFSSSMIKDLPEPAQRYFQFAIAEGTPLYTIAELSMTGMFGTGDKDAPNYMKMKAEQVLAAPEGFVWKMSGGFGLMKISGSDSAGWTRFWLAGMVPVARAGGTRDHCVSGFARYSSEAVFWTPAAVLPGPGIAWEAVDENTARVTMSHGGNRQVIDLTIDAKGRPVQIALQRWSNANPDREYRLQPFGGYLSEFRDFSGFKIPTHVEAGNHFGTDDYFPFFIADVTDVRYVR